MMKPASLRSNSLRLLLVIFSVVAAALAFAGVAAAAPSFRSMSTYASTQPATSLTLGRPNGVVAGDAMVAVVNLRQYSWVALTPPSGWTLVRRDASRSGGEMTQAVYVRVAGASEPSSYSWAYGNAGSAAGAILAYAGVDASNPVLASSGLISAQTQTIPAPSISPSINGAEIIGLFGNNGQTYTNAPTPLAERFEVETSGSSMNITLAAADALQAAAGPTGDLVATSSAKNVVSVGQLVALRPSGGATQSTSSSSGKPTNTALPPTSAALPAISGTTLSGGTLSTTAGTWNGTTPMTYAYQWRSCDSTGITCVPITGATSASFTLTTAQVGKTVRALVTATNTAGSASALSSATALIAAPPSTATPPPPTGSLLFKNLMPYASGGGNVQSPASGQAVNASSPAWGIARWH